MAQDSTQASPSSPSSPASETASAAPAQSGSQTPETPGPKGSDSAGVQDRVVMASRHADGSHAQSEDFEFIGPKSGVKEAARHQLVSAAHAALETASDLDYAPSAEDQEKVIGPAEEKADAEVEARHRGAFDDDAV